MTVTIPNKSLKPPEEWCKNMLSTRFELPLEDLSCWILQLKVTITKLPRGLNKQITCLLTLIMDAPAVLRPCNSQN